MSKKQEQDILRIKHERLVFIEKVQGVRLLRFFGTSKTQPMVFYLGVVL